jgi:superfamily II DNA or RNA helicase
MTVKVIKREAVFIPIKGIPVKALNRVKEKLSFKFYSEPACKKCDNLPYRHNDLCDQCPAYSGGYDLASRVVVKEKKYLKIPVGSSAGILEYLNGQHVDTRIVDKSPETKIAKIKFTGTLKPEQETSVDHVIAGIRGVLKAPPRSGKTVMATAVVCKLHKKTLILASQRDWLMGFHETFVGSKTQKPLTDLDPKRIKICKTLKEFEETDVCLATVQTFYSENGERLLRKIRDMFEVVIMDEVHTSAADKYVKIVARLNFRYGIGLSGTPSRKDGKYILVENVLGPIIHEVEVKGLRPHIFLTKTKYQKAYKGNVPWTRMVSSIENDKERLKLIAKCAIKDAEAGHMVMIPFSQVKPINSLIELINKMAGKKLAYPFTGQLKKGVRDETIQMAREYKIKILIGTLKIMSTGINIPRASMLYEVAMSSNAENAEQRMRRVLTPWEGKPTCGIRYFLDNMNVRKNCMRNEYFKVMLPKIKPVITDEQRIHLKDYFSVKTGAYGGSKLEL